MRLLFFPSLHVNHTQLRHRLAGKTVLITGASYGIGECLAEQLAETQAYLLLVARTEAKLLDVKHKVEAKGGQADIFPCDLRHEADVQALLDALPCISFPKGLISLLATQASPFAVQFLIPSIAPMISHER